MKKYQTQYENYTIHYEIESDVDGNRAVLKSVTNEKGAHVNEVFFDKETLADMRFIAESEYADLQFHHYMKTGETI